MTQTGRNYRILEPVSGHAAARKWPDIARALQKLEPGEWLPVQSEDRKELLQIRLDFGYAYQTKIVGNTVYMRPAFSKNRGPATLEAIGKEVIREALNSANGNITKAAKTLGIGRTTLYRKVRKYRLLTMRSA